MARIGENLNVRMSKIGKAMKERDPVPIRDMVERIAEKGVDYIDINMGPAPKDGPELMPWLINICQEVAPEIPLALDTTNMRAIEAGLPVCKNRPIINSIMARPERMETLIPLAAQYEADFIALLWGPSGMPRDENERAEHTVTLLSAAMEQGIPGERVWVDPIVTPVNVQQQQVKACLDFMAMLKDIAEGMGTEGVKSTCGLSNVSNGAPEPLRPILNQTYMIMLGKNGMYSAIVDAFDDEMASICKGGMERIRELVGNVMDGVEPDMGSLSKEETDYVKTTKILLGQSLYSDSWLEL
ncbi:MAG: dihydropteroate synthase [Deltaproteobacteria bacterium]|nr:dihydropteroate synthase [Deltaproteobacteria bacterium]MBW2308111.1 dihydropteroate synthase [Deltaproteobacteria bacterium]